MRLEAAAAPAPFSAELPLTLVGVVLHLELQLLPLQLQEVHLDLQVLLLRLQRILELDEFLEWGGRGRGRGRGGSVKSAGTTAGHKRGRSQRQLSTCRLRPPAPAVRCLNRRSCDQTGDGRPTAGVCLPQSASLAPPSFARDPRSGGKAER